MVSFESEIMRIVCFGQQNWDYCWTGKQQLMVRLARRGHDVLFVDADSVQQTSVPQAIHISLGNEAGRLRPIEPHLHVLTHNCWPYWGRPWNARMRKYALQAACRKLGLRQPLALAFRPDRQWLMESIKPAAMAYYAVDEWTGFGGLSKSLQAEFRTAEEKLLKDASLALCVSPRLAERFRQIAPGTVLLENGSDTVHFSPENLAAASPHPALAALHGPILGFVGQVDERLDQDLILTMARARPDWNIVLAGRPKQGVPLGALEDQPNVHLLGYQPYETLPSVMRHFDLCMLPYVQSPLTQSCNPLKVYEYLATGKPVVGVPLEGMVICRDVVRLADSSEAFISQVSQALVDPSSGRLERLELASRHSWDRRVDVLESLLLQCQQDALVATTFRRRGSMQRLRRRPPSVMVRPESAAELLKPFHR